MPTPPATAPRQILTAELLSIGSELTVGETRDTNAAELARSLTDSGVTVRRITALPDRLEVVADEFADGLSRADLVVSTGGLGPTPDDLTREAIAAVCGETPVVDHDLESWLRDLWARRDIPFPELNLKQAWLIPSAVALPNPNGTAPGWFVTRPDGRIAVALPGPPREMRPMWAEHALPRLRDRGLGAEVATRTFRLTGIGESQVAEILGEVLARGQNPEVATYARAEAVDVRVSAVGEAATGERGPRTAESLLEAGSAIVQERLGAYIWATGDTTWAGAIGDRLGALGWRLAVAEIGTHGQLGALLGDVDWLALAESMADDDPAPGEPGEDGLIGHARRVRKRSGSAVGLAVRARERGTDTAVSIAVVTPTGEHRQTRRAFLGGSHGRSRAALAAAAVLFGDVDWLALAESMADDDPAPGEPCDDGLIGHARRVRKRSGSAVGLAVRARERGTDTAVSIAVVTPTGEHRQTRRAFLGGSHGRSRAALAAAAVLFEALRSEGR